MKAKLSGSLTRGQIPRLIRELDAQLVGSESVVIDLAEVTELDSAGVALLSNAVRRLRQEGRGVSLQGASESVSRTLDLFPYLDANKGVAAVRISKREQLGDAAAEVYEVLLQYLVLTADTAYFTFQGLFKPKGIRWSAVAYEMAAMGSRATGVVGLISFLVGATMALQSAVQLRQFGANIFVVDLIGISLTRELGPLMAAIVVAGRSGSAVAAELGTMVISEELDALRTMGLHPTRFLVVPKLVAITITQPLLTMMANATGIFGGFLVAALYLEIGPSTFIARLQESLYVKDILTGLVKSVIFAQLIVTIGALCGLRTQGGADAVGRSTTTAVVASIFAVIVADAAASLVFYFGG